MSHAAERRLLQFAVALIGAFPVIAGFEGLIGGLGILGDADSRYRFLSGLQLGVGAAFWATIPKIEEKADLFRVLTLIVAVGGLARLGAAFAQPPSNAVLYAIAMELVITPLVCLWRERIERLNVDQPSRRPGPWE
jgi:hypothetical protein